MIGVNKMDTGIIITYKLPMSENPVNPSKLWRGKVIRYNNICVLVEILNPGYEGLTEWITVDLVIGASHENISAESQG